MTPNEAWLKLVEGNKRFVDGAVEGPHRDAARREELKAGQKPFACVFACGDSRVPVELLFDQGLGDVFVVRTAGHTVDTAVLASLEFAVVGLGVDVLVVLGHESCGAVGATKAALDGNGIPDSYQRFLVENIAPAAILSSGEGKATRKDMEERHVKETVNQILAECPKIKEATENDSCAVLGARYELSGLVTRLV